MPTTEEQERAEAAEAGVVEIQHNEYEEHLRILNGETSSSHIKKDEIVAKWIEEDKASQDALESKRNELHKQFDELREDYKKHVEGVELPVSESVRLKELLDISRFLYSKALMKCNMLDDALSDRKLIDAVADEIRGKYKNISIGDAIKAAEHELSLHARQIASTISSCFRMEYTGLIKGYKQSHDAAELVKVRFFMLDSNDETKKRAHYSPSSDTIYLDARYGTHDGHPLTALHEMGHWFDNKIRKVKKVSNDKDFQEALQKDYEHFKRHPGGSMEAFMKRIKIKEVNDGALDTRFSKNGSYERELMEEILEARIKKDI